MTVSIEMQAKVAEWRQKARDGTLTMDEMKEAIKFLRAERVAVAPAKQSTRKQAAAVNTDALLGELGI
jgi:SpoU rRNA methylase family enzyme